MKSNRNRRAEALETFNQGYNCAQAILAVYGKELGLDREHSFKIGAPFRGGIANTGDICGAVTAALMVLGLRYGETKSDGWFKKAKLYKTSRNFMKRFADAGGSIKCVEIKRPSDRRTWQDEKRRPLHECRGKCYTNIGITAVNTKFSVACS